MGGTQAKLTPNCQLARFSSFCPQCGGLWSFLFAFLLLFSSHILGAVARGRRAQRSKKTMHQRPRASSHGGGRWKWRWRYSSGDEFSSLRLVLLAVLLLAPFSHEVSDEQGEELNTKTTTTTTTTTPTTRFVANAAHFGTNKGGDIGDVPELPSHRRAGLESDADATPGIVTQFEAQHGLVAIGMVAELLNELNRAFCDQTLYRVYKCADYEAGTPYKLANPVDPELESNLLLVLTLPLDPCDIPASNICAFSNTQLVPLRRGRAAGLCTLNQVDP